MQWNFAIWFFAIILIGLTIVGYIVLYFAFTQSPSGVVGGACAINKWFIIVSAPVCALVLIMAVIPCGDRAPTRTPTTGILQAACVVSYIMYLTFSSLNAQVMVMVPEEQWPSNFTDEACMERCFHLPDPFVEWLRDKSDAIAKVDKSLSNITLDNPDLIDKTVDVLSAYENMIGKVAIERYLIQNIYLRTKWEHVLRISAHNKNNLFYTKKILSD